MLEAHQRHRAGFLACAIAGLLALALWEGEQRYATPPARWSVAGTIVVGLASAVILGRRRQRRRSGAWLIAAGGALRGDGRRPWTYATGIAVWAFIFAVVIAWDLFSFLRQSHDLPTLSYLFGRVTRHEAGRSALFLAWVAVGAYLAAGWRRSEAL